VLALCLGGAVLAGCAPGESPPGPRGLLRVDAPVLVALDAEPVAALPALRAAAPADAGARLAGLAAAGVGALTATPGARLLGTPLAALEAPTRAADCPTAGETLREAFETLRTAMRPAARAAANALREGVDREWHPVRPDPVVAAAATAPALDDARLAGHPVVLRVGPVTLAPGTRAAEGGDGCRATIEASVVLRAVRTFDGGVRFETVRRLTLAEAPDVDALRAWASDPARVEAALHRLGERLADDVRWLL
jgi:hypothetical protein